MECLHHLEAQTWQDFEVVIVDDGSTDNTRSLVEKYRQHSPFSLRYLHQTNSGPAKARNWAISAMQAPISILIGDDIFPASNFVQVHLDYHRAHSKLEVVAVGLTRWKEQGQLVTPFMRWLDSHGVQFAYNDLLQGAAPSWKHFYTSNLSFKTEYLRQNLFHEAFHKAAMEDIELGYRLATRHGLSMAFLSDAIAEHLHPTSFRRACRRAIDVGAATHLFGELWPEHRLLPPQRFLPRLLLPLLIEDRIVLPALLLVTDLLNRIWLPNPFTQQVLLLHTRLGYQREANRQTYSR